jgi:hypothetical protein
MMIAACGLAVLGASVADGGQNPSSGAEEKSAAVETFKIAGTAVNAMTGAPLGSARISIADTKERTKVISMVASEGGHFEFSGLKAGKYSLEGAKRGYIPAAYEQHEQFSTAIVTGPEFATEHLVLRLMPMAMITGHVLDEFGEAVRSAQVSLFREDRGEGMKRILRAGNATSDDRGFFDFNLLQPGIYYASVSAKPWYAVHPITAAEGGNTGQHVSPALDAAYPTTYYGGATEAEGAAPIEVKGGDREKIEIRLIPGPALHLVFRTPEGQAEQQGNSLARPVLQKRVFDSVQHVQTEGVQQVAPGVYEITGVAPGHYTVRTKSGEPGQRGQSTDLELSRNGQELSGSEGEALGSVKMKIKMPGHETLPKQYGVFLQDSRGRAAGFTQGDASGQVTFEDVVPEKYAILFGVLGGPAKPYTVVRTSSAAGDSSGHYVNVTAGATVELTAYLAGGVMRIEGVAQKNGKPVEGVMVALVPNDPEMHREMFRRDQSDFDGTFSIPGVIPGTYTIVAVEDAWGFEWAQPGVLARYVQHGQEVIVGEEMRGTLYLPEPVEVQAH